MLPAAAQHADRGTTCMAETPSCEDWHALQLWYTGVGARDLLGRSARQLKKKLQVQPPRHVLSCLCSRYALLAAVLVSAALAWSPGPANPAKLQLHGPSSSQEYDFCQDTPQDNSRVSWQPSHSLLLGQCHTSSRSTRASRNLSCLGTQAVESCIYTYAHLACCCLLCRHASDILRTAAQLVLH